MPRISWRRENNAILPTGGAIYRGTVLKIKSIQKEDRGTYYCVADNGVGRGARRELHFHNNTYTQIPYCVYSMKLIAIGKKTT